MAHHRYAKSKDPKKRARQAKKHGLARSRVRALRMDTHKTGILRSFAYLGYDITRNTGGPDNQRWAATKPSTKEGFSGVHIGDYATIGAARRAIDGFKAVLSGRG